MASTPEGRRLTEAHRQAQGRVRAEFMAQFLVLWELLDSRRLDETGPGWVAAVLGLIRPFRLQSALVSTGYFTEFRELEAPRPRIARESAARPRPSDGTPPPQPARPTPTPAQPSRPGPTRAARSTRRNQVEWDLPTFEPTPPRRIRIDIPEIDWTPSDRAARVSLTVTGPVSQKSKASRGKPLALARDESMVEAAGAASRHVLTGGRQSLLTLVDSDPQTFGWIRVTDGDPCAFCAMLASRGPVFGRYSGVDANARFEGPGTVKVHDNCACTIEPVYSLSAPWPGRAREFQKLWGEVVGFAPNNRFSGQEAINAFRREYERRQRGAGREVA